MEILFVGASITSAFGIPKKYSFPSIIQDKLNESNIDLDVVNSAYEGTTSRDALMLSNGHIKPGTTKFVVNALGLGDIMYGISFEEIEKNLADFFTHIRNIDSNIIIIQIQQEYFQYEYLHLSEHQRNEYEELFKRITRECDIELIPFFLRRVANDPKLNLSDLIHPNIEGMRIVAENVWEDILPIIEESI